MIETRPPRQSKERPENAPDHAYYHLDELPPTQRELFDYKRSTAITFYQELATDFAQRIQGKRKIDDVDGRGYTSQGEFISDEVREHAEKKGALTPIEIIDLFDTYKKNELSQTVKKMVKSFDKGDDSQVNFYTKVLVAKEKMSLYDVWLRATYDMDAEKHNPKRVSERPSAFARDKDLSMFDQYVSMIEEAMDTAGHRPDVADYTPV